MLTNLSISNYALIQKLEMEPSEGLNMITGETGAGKSIMLGAVGLLLGNRADTKVLFDDEKKCVIEGVFRIDTYGLEGFFHAEELDYDVHCIIRREISPTGKSRAFINDTPVKLEVLKQLGKSLMDIHSQHENLLLGGTAYQLSLIDAYGQTRPELEAYQKAFKNYSQHKAAFQNLSNAAFDLQKEADYNKFQLEELSSLALEEGEQARLEEQQELLDHAEEIKEKIVDCLQLMNEEPFGVLQSLSSLQHNLQHLSRFSQQFSDLKERFQSVMIEIKDIEETLTQEEQTIEVDFEKQEFVRDRLSKIYQLQKKHGLQSVEALIGLMDQLAEKVFQVDHLEDELKKLKEQLEDSEKELVATGKKLSQKRRACFDAFSKDLKHLLGQLGMENANVKIQQMEIAPSNQGMDQIEFFFTANKGVNPQSIGLVASGGEFSRLMFAIKYIMADKIALPTLIFDEIDTGISGEVALQMVSMMQNIAKKHQVICISHLPQVAAKGEHHYFVYKDNSTAKTISKIKLLTPQERLTEIAKMIAGSNPSSSALESARDLLHS